MLVRRLLELNVIDKQTMLSFQVCASFFVEYVAGDLRAMDDATHFTAALLSARLRISSGEISSMCVAIVQVRPYISCSPRPTARPIARTRVCASASRSTRSNVETPQVVCVIGTRRRRLLGGARG
jgi:hypothetical protein